jgi:hypothetical protein
MKDFLSERPVASDTKHNAEKFWCGRLVKGLEGSLVAARGRLQQSRERVSVVAIADSKLILR